MATGIPKWQGPTQDEKGVIGSVLTQPLMLHSDIHFLQKRHFEWTDQSSTEYTSWAPGEPHKLKKQCVALCKPGEGKIFTVYRWKLTYQGGKLGSFQDNP